jgi:hypothetical protein
MLGCGKVVADPILSEAPGADGGGGSGGTVYGEWVRTFDGALGNDLARAVAPLADGDLMIAGSLSADETTTRLWVARLSPLGETRWSKTFETTDGQVRGIALDAQGVATLGGALRTATNLPRVWLARVAPVAGELLWAIDFPSDASFKAEAYGLSVDRLGRGGVVGLTTSAAGDNDAWAASFDENGSLVWTHTEKGNAEGHDAAFDVITNDDRSMVLVGYVTTLTQGQDALIRKLDGAGRTLWTQVRDSGENADDVAHAVAADALSNTYVVGSEAASVNAWVAKYSPDGMLLWSHRSNRSKSVARDVTVDSAGNIVLCGYATGDAGKRVAWVWRLDSNGASLNDRVLSESEGECYGVMSWSPGTIVVTGYIASLDRKADAIVQRWEL